MQGSPPLPTRSWTIATTGVVIAALIALAGCDKQPDQADELRALLPVWQAQIEHRAIKALMSHVATDYRDRAGRDRAGAKRALERQFRRHRKRHIALALRSLKADQGRGSIAVLAAVGNRPMADFEAMLEAASMVIYLDLTLRRDDGKWRVIATSWRRPTPLDLL